MSASGAVFVIAALIAVGIVLAWFLLQRQHPEAGSSHTRSERTGSEQYHSDLGRPAGPGAEADGLADRGQPVPGPTAEFTDRDV
jgi:hypothetical protein